MAGVWEGERCADGVPAAADANSVRDCGTVAGPRLLLYSLYIYTRLLIYIHTLLLHRSVCDPSIGRLTEIKTFTSGEPIADGRKALPLLYISASPARPASSESCGVRVADPSPRSDPRPTERK